MMDIEFTQLYAEVGASFHIAPEVLGLLSTRLNDLHKTIPHYETLYDGHDFQLTIYITATRKNESVEIKGPIVLRKRRDVEFTVWLPYKDIDDNKERVIHILRHLGQGLYLILKKYRVDDSGVLDVMESVIDQASDLQAEFNRQREKRIPRI